MSKHTSRRHLKALVLYQLFKTVHDIEFLSGTVKFADIPGSHPAICGERLCVCFWVIQVAFHDTGTAYEKFTFLIRSQFYKYC